MKRFLLFIAAVTITVTLFAQAVPRSWVVVEIGTGTWCTYCPGAANGAHDLLANGQQVAVIENHNGDVFANTYSNARNSWYGITGYPTAFFDGVLSHVGGQACPNGNVYTTYLNLYNQRISVPSPLKIDIAGTSSGNTYNITLSIQKVSTITATDMKVHLVLTENNIATSPWPGSSGCMNDVEHVTRLMVPNENGTSINFTNGDMQIITLSFTKDATWVTGECELVAFVQDNSSKEIFNSSKVALTALPPPMTVNFTGTPTTGCAPVNVSFTDQSAGATNWQWNCPGGTPATSSQQNPTITYNASGTFDVTLTAWNSATGRGGKMVKTAYLNITGAPAAPPAPMGNNWLCSNPPNQGYSTTGSTGATSYDWDLSPASAGVVTPAGTSCTVDFENSFTGTANLKVRGVNSCGTGAWSAVQAITISTDPGQCPAPTGDDQLCMDPPNTTYTTAGISGYSTYVWQLLPTTAGTMMMSGTTCTIDWNATWTGTADLRVKVINNSCEGAYSEPILIDISTAPQAYNTTGGGVYCAQGGAGVAVGVDGSQTGVNYLLYLDGTATGASIPGTGSAITFGNQMNAGTYTAKANDPTSSCETTMNGNALVTVDPEPPQTPGEPTGPEHVFTGSTPTTDYTTTGGTYATSYSWNVTPAEAGTFAGNTTTGTITWNQTYSGQASIKVQGVNSCGGGSYSVDLEVTVDVGVGIPEMSKHQYFSVYPNPSKGKITLLAPSPTSASAKIFNPAGFAIANFPDLRLENTVSMDISGLSSGMYILEVISGDRTERIKLIVE